MTVPMTLADLREAAQRLPEGALITLPREAILGALETHTHIQAEVATIRNEKLVNAAEAAQRLNLERDRVYELCRRKIIPHVRIGRQLRFAPVALDAWIASGGS